MVLKPDGASESPSGLVKTQIAGPALIVSDSVGLRWGPRTCISSKLMLLVQGPHYENHCSREVCTKRHVYGSLRQHWSLLKSSDTNLLVNEQQILQIAHSIVRQLNTVE